MSMQSFEFEESTIHEPSGLDNTRPSSARTRRKEEKRGMTSPYGSVNPRQAWLASMNQGQSFNNMTSSGYGVKDPTPPTKIRTKTVNRASHLDKEQMYDEIQRLKGLIAAFTKEKSLRMTKITKLEKELSKKDKLIEETFSQTQSVYGPISERSYGGTSIESSSTITGLRQKCHKVESLLRDKDNEIKTLKSDIKTTRLQELEIMCDTYYQEITRLTLVLEQRDHVTLPRATPRTSTPVNQSSDREKILEAKLQKVEVDNATLRKQITKSTVKSSGDSTGVISEYASLSRAELEEKHQLKCKELFDANLTIEELKTKSAVADDAMQQLNSKHTKHAENVEKLADDRIKLDQKLAAIQGEHHAQKLVIKRLNKTIRQNEDELEKLRKQIDKDQKLSKERLTQKTKIITSLESEIEELNKIISEKDGHGLTAEEDKIVEVKSAKRQTKLSPKKSNEKIKDILNGNEVRVERETLKKVKQNPEARLGTKETKTKKEWSDDKENKEAAARKIQKNYRNHNLIKSVSLVQQVLRGHALRCKVAKEEHNQSAEVIQSALKGFSVKSQHIDSLKSENQVIKRKAEPLKSPTSKEIPKIKPKEIKPVAKTPGVQKIISKTEGPLRKTETKLSGVKKVTSPKENPPIKEVETTTDEDDLIMM